MIMMEKLILKKDALNALYCCKMRIFSKFVFSEIKKQIFHNFFCFVR